MREHPFQHCADAADVVDETEQDHEDGLTQTFFVRSWQELLYLMTDGEHGDKPRETSHAAETHHHKAKSR